MEAFLMDCLQVWGAVLGVGLFTIGVLILVFAFVGVVMLLDREFCEEHGMSARANLTICGILFIMGPPVMMLGKCILGLVSKL